MTTFRRIEEMHEREIFTGEYTTYDAFLYQGPFTDYPQWAQYAFQNLDMKAPKAHALLIDRTPNVYPNMQVRNPSWPVDNGSWVMQVYHHVSQHEYTLTLRVYTTEELRMEFFPSGELTTDEAIEYFDVGDLTEGTVMVQVPVYFRAFQWKGVAHSMPSWLQTALKDGAVTMRGASLYHMMDVARPKDWILMNHLSQIRVMTQAQYEEAGGK